MRGDVVLFRGSKSLPDWFIMTFTGGPFVHCEVDVGNGLWVGMSSAGMRRHTGDPRNTATIHPQSRFGQSGIDVGLDWVDARYIEAVQNKEAHEYGWWDIVSDGMKAIGLGFLTFGRKGEWNCSDFVTRYLVIAGAADPLGDLADNPGTVSPNDIARAFRVPMK